MTRTARSRKHKGFDLEKRLSRVESCIERRPAIWRGCWNKWRPAVVPSIDDILAGQMPEPIDPTAKRWNEVRIDLGCGKGAFTVACAQAQPEVLFVGIDIEPVCAMHGAEVAKDAGVQNAVFTIDENPHVDALFAPNEVSAIYMNFPAPFPKKKYADRRLTHVSRLIAYRSVLKQDGELWLKTDSEPLFIYSLGQLELAGFDVVWKTDDCRAARPDDPYTLYEEKLSAQGACVYALCAKQRAGAVPRLEDIVQTDPQSLYDYLPDDLEGMTYVPHGMANGVENMINQRRNQHDRASVQRESNGN